MKLVQSGNVLSIYENVDADWEQWYLLLSDVHHDSILCNRDFELYHLQEAMKRNARILYFGDTLDGMQGRYDPRRSYDEIRPEYCRGNYYNLIVDDLAKFLEPFATNILMFGRGNHETGILKNANIDVLSMLTYRLSQFTHEEVRVGGFGGWVRFMYLRMNDAYDSSIKLKYFHGSGGDAPVTKGTIQTNRQAVYQPDANIIVNGHSHNMYYVPITRERLSNKGVQYFDIQHHLRIPGYKQDYADGSGGWPVEKGFCPKPIGAIWMRQYWKNDHVNLQFLPDIQGPEAVAPTHSSELVDKMAYPQDGDDF